MATYETPSQYNKHFDIAIGPILSGDSDSTGNITVDSDMPNQGSNVTFANGAWFKARAGNTGILYIGFDSGVDSTDFELSAGDVIPVQASNLNQLWFYAATAGDQICWLKA